MNSNPLVILIHGYTGKLGNAIYQHLKAHYSLIGCNRSYPILQALDAKKPDVIIDVTNATAISQHIPLYLSLKIPTIIGSSGILPSLAYSLTQKADFPLMIVPNFSLSFQNFAGACSTLNTYSGSIRIIETHHKSKLDSPSATSLFLAHMLNTTVIDSVRVDDYIAKHEVIFEHPNHTISLSHTIKNHSEFLEGVDAALTLLLQQNTSMVLFSDQ